MKRFARIFTVTAAVVLLSGLVLAQDDDDDNNNSNDNPIAQYVPAYQTQYQEPQFPTGPVPTVSPTPFPTGIPVGPGTLSPTFNPPGVRYTIPF